MEKKMKVRITKKVHGFRYNEHRYVPGDIVEIPTRLFHPEFMEKVEPAPKKEEAVEPTEPLEELRQVEEPQPQEKPKEKKKRVF